MRVILTGCTGFLGGHLVEAFQQQGHSVAGIIRSNSSAKAPLLADIELFEASLHDCPRLQQAMKRADVVVHAAAKVHTHGLWREFVEGTIETTRDVLHAASNAGVPRFVQISTVGVYGFPSRRNNTPFRETDAYGAIHRWNYYSRAKAEAEKIVFAAHQTGRIAATAIRPTLMYGPRDSTTFDRIVAALRKRRMKWIGDGQNKLSLIHVSDAAKAIVLAATSPKATGKAYNVAADEISPTQREFVTRICELMDLPPPPSTVPYSVAYATGFASEGIAHLSRYHVCPPVTRLTVLLFGGSRRFSSDSIRTELGWQPAVSFEEGIRQTTEWYRQWRSAPTSVPSV
jgi:nucleoside-diphosphate-sugar epimerase